LASAVKKLTIAFVMYLHVMFAVFKV